MTPFTNVPRLPGRMLAISALLTFFVLSSQSIGRAHDIPVDILVQTFVRPDGARLRLLVRVPLAAMRDVDFPLHGQNFLNFPEPDGLLRDAARTWLASAIAIEEDGTRLPAPAVAATRVSLPSDSSFASYDAALAHVLGPPLPASTELVWNQAMLDVLFEYPIQSDRATFAIDPTLARLGLRVVTTLRFLPPGGAVRAFEWTGDPGLVRLDPSWRQAAWQFVGLGFRHILDGTDHLLFLLCLVIPFRRPRQLVLIVTSFTVAHSITLAASALDLMPSALWFPPLIETLIATSIVYMALENVVMASTATGAGAGATGASLRRRWVITFAFGLVHGFGFSFALRQTLQFAGAHLAASLVSFNVGIELGQLLVLALMLPVLGAVFRWIVAERVGTIILSALVAHTAWHWMIERADRLRQFSPPAFDAGALALVLRWVAGAVIVAALVWMARAVRARSPREAKSEEP